MIQCLKLTQVSQVVKLAERKRLFEGYHSFEGFKPHALFYVHVTLILNPGSRGKELLSPSPAIKAVFRARET